MTHTRIFTSLTLIFLRINEDVTLDIRESLFGSFGCDAFFGNITFYYIILNASMKTFEDFGGKKYASSIK